MTYKRLETDCKSFCEFGLITNNYNIAYNIKKNKAENYCGRKSYYINNVLHISHACFISIIYSDIAKLMRKTTIDETTGLIFEQSYSSGNK